MRGNLGNLKRSNTGTQEPLNRKYSNWPPSIFSRYCAAGATFLLGAALFVPVKKRKNKKVVGKKKKACIRILLIPSQPRPQVRLLLSPWPPCLSAPTVLLPRHHHLFPGTDLCLPHAEKTQTADTLTRENTGGKECVFMAPQPDRRL